MNVEELRQLIGQRPTFPQAEVFACPQVTTGVPVGAITEVCGSGKTEFAAQFLATHRELPSVWVDQQHSVFPIALQQRQVNLQTLLFVEASSHLLWTLQQLLSSQLFKIIVAPQEFDNLKHLRRLQLNCESARCCLMLLGQQPSPTWPIALKIQLQQAKVIHLQGRRFTK